MIRKRNVSSFIVTLNAFHVRPHVWHGRCPGDTSIPAKPSQACLVWRRRLLCSCALCNSGSVFGSGGGNVNIVLDETPQEEEITHCQVRWPAWPSVRRPFPSSTCLRFFPRDDSSNYRTIADVTFAACNRHEFHDLANTSYSSYDVKKCSDYLYAPCISYEMQECKHNDTHRFSFALQSGVELHSIRQCRMGNLKTWNVDPYIQLVIFHYSSLLCQ